MIQRIYDTLRAGIRSHMAYNRTEKLLGQLNGRQLQDIGISRSDIPRLAEDAAAKARGNLARIGA